MMGFTIFLVYIYKFRKDANCYCFGNIIEVNPLDSVLKNMIIIFFLLFIRNEDDYRFPCKRLIMGIFIAIAIVVPFIVLPMDLVYNKVAAVLNKDAVHSQINETAFVELFQDSTLQHIEFRENQMVVVYTAGCSFCKLGMKKIKSIFEKNSISQEKLVILILGNEEYIQKFQKETESQNFVFHMINEREVAIKAQKAIYGTFPTFIYVKNDLPIKAVDLRRLYENDVVDFLQKGTVK
jgi:hypothetical protein